MSKVWLPALWVLLAITTVSSKSYYCNDLPCTAKHYLYPILVILRNPDMRRALLVFGSAMGSALAVLFTLWCILLGLAAMAMVLLVGKFQTQDFVTDNQFHDLYTAFTTMFVYVNSADNYTSTAGLANDLGTFHMLFFVLCTVAGAFFITALLIDVFCGSYDEDHADTLKSQRREWEYCDAAVVAIWERHSTYAQAVNKLQSESRANSGGSVSFSKEGLPFDAFMDLVFSACMVGDDRVMQECEYLISTIVQKLEAKYTNQDTIGRHTVTPVEQRIVRELLDICAETSLTMLFQRLQRFSPEASKVCITEWRVNQLFSIGADYIDAADMANISWDEVQWARGRSPSDNNLQAAVAILPKLKGLIEPEQGDTMQLDLYIFTCRVLRLEYLRKWCVHRIFQCLDKSGDGTVDPREFRLLWPMVQTMSKMTTSKHVQVEGYLMAIHTESDKLIIKMQNNMPYDEAELARIFRTFQTNQTGKSGMTQARQTHEINEVFERYADTALGGIPLPQLREALLDGIFKWKNEESMQERAVEITEELNLELQFPQELSVMNPVFASVADRVASAADFYRLRQRLINMGLADHMETLPESDRALLLLTRERAYVLEQQKLASRGFLDCEALLFTLFQGAAWWNVLVMSLYYTADSTTTLDALMIVFSLLQCAEQTYLKYKRSQSQSDKDKYQSQIGTLVCLCVSLFGVVALIVGDSNLMAIGTARFLAGFSTVCIFTQNIRFTEVMTTASTMSKLAWPLVGSLIAITCLYALTARQLFNDNAYNETFSAFFDTYSRSLSTFFRLFVAEGWTDIMYSGTRATNSSARLFFSSYILLATLLFAQLTIGWIVSVFGLVQKIGSEKVYRFLLTFVAPGAYNSPCHPCCIWYAAITRCNFKQLIRLAAL